MAEELFYATGKRKTAVARVWMKPGNGQITINKKPMEQYVARESDRMLIMEPLKTNTARSASLIYESMSGVVAFPDRQGLSGTASAGRSSLLIPNQGGTPLKKPAS